MMTHAERSQRAWINNDPNAADLADLAEQTNLAEFAYTHYGTLDDILARCDGQDGETAEQTLAEVKALLSELIASI